MDRPTPNTLQPVQGAIRDLMAWCAGVLAELPSDDPDSDVHRCYLTGIEGGLRLAAGGAERWAAYLAHRAAQDSAPS